MRLPEIVGDTWFNTKPLGTDDLAGKVVLADFWTYSCVNCQRTLPYLRQWHERYKDKGFVLLGIHTPEFDFEKEKITFNQFFNSPLKRVIVGSFFRFQKEFVINTSWNSDFYNRLSFIGGKKNKIKKKQIEQLI